MTEEKDQEIRRATERMIKQHGARALTEANRMLNNVIPQRDAEDIAWWRAVSKAIQELQSKGKL